MVEDDDAADTGNRTINEKALQKAGAEQVADRCAQQAEPGFDQVHEGLRPGKHRLEHQEEQRKQDQQAGNGCSSTLSMRVVSVSGFGG